MSEKNEWKLVPVVPTDDMEVAAENDYEQTGATFPRWKSAYAAMLAAAPPVPPASDAPEKVNRRQLRRNSTDAKDAERYRGLRAMACSASAAERAKAFEALSHGQWWHEKDAAIDAAISSQAGR